jgi:hypothetical protein
VPINPIRHGIANLSLLDPDHNPERDPILAIRSLIVEKYVRVSKITK